MTDRRPRLSKTLGLRAEALRVLHLQEIALLRRWRELRNSGDEAAADKLLPELLLSINAIASGLRTLRPSHDMNITHIMPIRPSTSYGFSKSLRTDASASCSPGNFGRYRTATLHFASAVSAGPGA